MEDVLRRKEPGRLLSSSQYLSTKRFSNGVTSLASLRDRPDGQKMAANCTVSRRCSLASAFMIRSLPPFWLERAGGRDAAKPWCLQPRVQVERKLTWGLASSELLWCAAQQEVGKTYCKQGRNKCALGGNQFGVRQSGGFNKLGD